MSEETEDVKPKLSLVINYEGTRQSSLHVIPTRSTGIDNPWPEITVKVKHNMSFKKIFDAAEVST